MSRIVRFSFCSEAEKADFEAYAKARGLTLAAFARHACFTVKDKYRLGAHHPTKRAGRQQRPTVNGQSKVVAEPPVEAVSRE